MPSRSTILGRLFPSWVAIRRQKFTFTKQSRYNQILQMRTAIYGNAFLMNGQYADAEKALRLALKLKPRFPEARINLGLTLSFLGRLRDARPHFEKTLKYQPRNADALFGMALIAMTEGNFDEAAVLLSGALRINPRMSRALASQAGLRKMKSSDSAWR